MSLANPSAIVPLCVPILKFTNCSGSEMFRPSAKHAPALNAKMIIVAKIFFMILFPPVSKFIFNFNGEYYTQDF